MPFVVSSDRGITFSVKGVQITLGREIYATKELRDWVARRLPSNELFGFKIPLKDQPSLRDVLERFLETYEPEPGSGSEQDDEAYGLALAEGITEARKLSRTAIASAPTRVETSTLGREVPPERYQVYTDGGADAPNPGRAGWGCALYLLDPADTTPRQTSASLVRAMCHGEKRATNGRMEWMGALKGLGLIPEGSECDVYFDATYVLNSIGQGSFGGTFKGWMGGWAKKGWEDRPNVELIREVHDKILEMHAKGTRMTFHWVGSHGKAQTDPTSDPAKNAYADQLAEKGKSKAPT